MTIARTISTEAEWENLPIGTLARVRYLEHDDDGNEVDEGKSMSILRVDGDARANAGDCMLAGGKYWSEVWMWEQGVTVIDPATLPEPEFETPDPSLTDAVAAVDAAIAGHAERVARLNKTPYSEYLNLPPEAHPAPTPARDIVEALQARGWAPAPVYPEGVQVWTISGVPDGGRSDGTQAYLSLPAGDPDFQLRSDIWLDQPTVSVNFELPRRTVNY
jgi:hypothetical protein